MLGIVAMFAACSASSEGYVVTGTFPDSTLNGKTVYGNSNNYEPIRVRFDSIVTIVDSVGTGKVTGGANTFGVVYSMLIVNGGTFIGTQYGASSSGDSTVIINGGTFEGKYGGCFYDCDVIINGGTFTGTEYGLYVRKTGGDTSTTTINGGTISGTVCDIYFYSPESRVTLSAGENGVGASFPGGLSCGGTDLGKRPLNSLLGEGMTYWVNGNAVSFADDVYEFSGGDVTVRKICEHTYESVVTPPTYNADGYTTHTCTTCGHSYEDTIVPATGFVLAGATTTLGGELEMNFYIDPADLTGTDYYAVITLYAADSTVTTTVPYADWLARSGYLIVTQKGLAARQMADKMEVVIYNGDGTQASFMWTDSIRGYAMRILEGQSDECKTLIVDMLNYGAAAQNQFKYNTADLANNQLSQAQQSYATPSVTCVDQRVQGEGYCGTTLILEDRILLTPYFNNITPDMYAIVSFTDHLGVVHETRVEGSDFLPNGNMYGVVCNELVVADGDQLVTVTVYDAEGNVVASASDTVNSYLARQMGGAEIFEMVAKFTTSAYAYFH